MLDQHQLEKFLGEHWTRRIFLSRISEEDFHLLQKELANFDPAAIIRGHQGNVASVWLEDLEGHTQAVDMSPSDALKFYEAGMTVFLPDVKTPTVERWHEELARSLNRPPLNFLSSLFISKNGNVSGCHFDHIENFTVQLRGTKSWRIIENSHAPLPTVNYSMRAARPYLEDIWLYGKRPFPAAIGNNAERVTVTPGALLYVPRGFWHEVETAADSISLLLGFPAYTWADVVLSSLRTMLLRHIEWRENAVYPYDAKSWKTAHLRLGQLCCQLATFLDKVDPAEFLPHVIEPTNRSGNVHTTFRRNPLCTLGIYPVGDTHVDLIASLHQGDLSRTREARVPAAWIPVLEAVDQSLQISQATLAKQHPEICEDLPRIFELIVALEVIRPEVTAAGCSAGDPRVLDCAS